MQVSGLTVAYEVDPVFTNLSLAVQPGEIFGLVGLNGEGKTTLIKTCMTLMEAQGGEVAFFGRSNQVSESRRQVAYLPERFTPPRLLGGDEFLRLSLGFHGLKFERETARGLAATIGMDPDLLSARVSTYSKGNAQKLGLLATLLTGCPLLILDEPMSGLDPLARTSLKQRMQDYRLQGRAIFLSSHILTDLDELCDRVAVLHAGHLVFVGSPAQLKAQTGKDDLENAFLSAIGRSAASACR